MKLRNTMLPSAALIALAVPATVQAQQTAPSASDEPNDEIVVTAQKRTERLQDVPISIATLSAEALKTTPITDITTIQFASAAVTGSGNSTSQPQVAIRGIVSNDFSIGADPALGIYVDDVYTGRSGGSTQELADIERVEIVKGPQGTLFGRNTTAGAIHIVTPKPDFTRFSGEVSAAGGEYNYFKGTLVANVPLSDQVAFRASGVYHRRDGAFANSIGGRDLDAMDRLAGRAALRWKPNANLDIILTVEGERDRDDPLIARSITFPIPGDANFGTVRGPISSNAPLRNDRDLYGTNLRVEWQLGRYSLTSISAIRGYRIRYLEDTDSTPLNQLHFGGYERQDAQSQEIRLTSPGDDRFHWFVGASLYHERILADSTAYYDEDAVCTGLAFSPSSISCDTLFRLVPSPDPAAPSLLDYLVAVGAAADPYVGATGQTEINRSRGNYFSWGIYGDATFDITPQLSVTGGLRYSNDRKSVLIAADPTANVLTLINGGNLILREGQQNAAQRWTQLQPRGVITWKPSRDLTFYASYTRGYKSGGFNVLQPGDPSFRPETVSSYEGGSKGSLFGHKLYYEIAGFYWDYSDLQVQVFEGGLPIVRNAGRARGYGVEASLDARLGHGIQLLLDGAWLDARYSQFTPTPGIDYSGNRLILAPEFTGHAGLVYGRQIGDGKLGLRFDYVYRTQTFYSSDNGPLQQPGYGLASARLGYTFGKSGFELAVRGENLANVRYAVSGQAIDALNIADLRVGQPRVISVELGFKW